MYVIVVWCFGNNSCVFGQMGPLLSYGQETVGEGGGAHCAQPGGPATEHAQSYRWHHRRYFSSYLSSR